MSRRFHVLKTNAMGEAPLQMAFVDTEATRDADIDGVEHQKLMMGYCEIWTIRSWDNDTPRLATAFIFHDTATFWDKILAFPRPKTKLSIFAHNWQYDAAILKLEDVLEHEDTRIMKLIADGGVFFVKMRIGERSYQLLDTTNLFPGSLARLGDSIGLPKMSMPEQTEGATPWEEYCKNDVAIVRQAVFLYLTFLNTNDLGNFQPTLAGQSFSAYRHRFMHTSIYIHNDERVLELERAAYYGGRVECWHIGEYDGNFTKFDINSMYPAVMLCEPMPTKLIASRPSGTPETLRKAMASHLVIARVTLKTTNAAYPLRHNDKLMFPHGVYTTTLCTPELRYALDHGDIVKVHDMALYEGSVIFNEYVDFFYTGRMQYAADGNTTFSYMCKLLLNSLYGKFGQRQGTWQDTNEMPPPPPGVTQWTHLAEDGGKPRLFRLLGSQVQERMRGGESYNSFPAVAAHVTAYARMLLWDMMQECELEHLYYVDTDSLMTDPIGAANLMHRVDNKRLGYLKVEGTAEHIILNGPKDYSFGWNTYLKGVSGKAIKLGPNTFSQPQFGKWSSSLLKGIRGEVVVRPVVKVLSRTYGKGTVLADGQVVPLVLGSS